MVFYIDVDPDTGYGRGVYQGGALRETPLELVYGIANAVTVRLATGGKTAADVPVADFTRTVVRIVWPDEVLAVTDEGIEVGTDQDGFITIAVAELELNTPGIVNRICDHRVESCNNEPDYEERHTYCRATLEILGYASFDDENICRRLGIPIQISNRNKQPLTTPPEPRMDYLTAQETAQAIAQALATVSVNASFVPVATTCYYHADYGTVSYLDDDNSIEALGYQATGWSKIKLWPVTADSSVIGNIALTVGTERFVVAVGSTVSMSELTFSAPVTGIITIVRNTTDAADTLKDGSGNVVTALVVDWRAY